MTEKAAVAWVGHLTEAPPGSQPCGAARRGGTAAQAWTAVACLALVLATAFALAVVALRLPGVAWGSMQAFRTALLLHVDLAIFAWLLATAAAQWSAAASPAAGRGPAALAAAATVALAASFLGGGEPVMADYLPWLAGNPLFTAAIVLLAVASAVAAAGALRAFLSGREPVAWRGIGLTALPFLLALLAAAGEVGRGVRDITGIVWAAGHVMLFGHVAVLCWEWPTLARRPVPRGPLVAGAALAGLLTALPWLGLLDDAALRAAYTTAMRTVLWLPPLWVALRLRGVGRAWWPSAALLALGCLLGALIEAPTTLVTAHYHAALGAVVVSRMAMTYRAAGTLAGGDVPVHSAARQLAVYVTGLVLLAGGLALAAVDGAPRKTSAAATAHKGVAYRTGMAISGSGGVVALVGTVWLVLNLGGTLRRRREANDDDKCGQ